MKRISICIAAFAALASCAFAGDEADKVTVYRLELHSDAAGNETTYVVGADGVARPVVLVDPAEYRILNERLETVWASLHSTSDGRRKLHGKLERTEIDEAKREKTEVYADGYRYVEVMPVKRTRPSAKVSKTPPSPVEPKKPANVSDRHWQMRQALLKVKKNKPKEVTVEHDAVTGKDEVK